jgi:energy-coupling factor transporter transmembrane protein EcfT
MVVSSLFIHKKIYKKNISREIKSTRIEFFSLIHYVYVTYRYNLDEYMILLIQKHNN